MTLELDIPETAAALDEFVSAVSTEVQRQIAQNPVAQAAGPLAEAGGKYLRTRVLWLSAVAVRPRRAARLEEPLVRAATAIELAHLGSLIHDDMVDGAATRRGVPSVHLQFGMTAAYLAGTALLHLGSALIADFSIPSRTSLARAVLAMCRGQVRELMGLFQPCSRRERLAIMRDKTAALLEATAWLGVAVVRGSRQEAKALRRFAGALGIAYQIKDDLMDLVGDPLRLGRANGADLWAGVMTLPILIARQRSRSVASALQLVRTRAKAAEVVRCIHLIRETGAIEAATAVACRWAAAASDAISSIPADPVTRRSLDTLAHELSRVEPAACVQVSETPARTHMLSQPLFAALDSGCLPPRGGNNSCAAGHADAIILQRLTWVEPTLADAIWRRTRTAAAAPLVTRPLEDNQTATPAAIAAATRAVELARSVASDDGLRWSPVAHVVAADCLEAVAFACLAESDSTLHAYVDELCLLLLHSEYRRSRTRLNAECQSSPAL